MAQIRITLTYQNVSNHTADRQRELKDLVYNSLRELMDDDSLSYELFYDGARMPEFKFMTIGEAADAADEVRHGILFGDEPDLGKDLLPIAEQHFLLALNSLDTAVRYFKLAQCDFDAAVDQKHSDDV